MAVVKNIIVRAGADFSAITKQAAKAKTAMTGMKTTVNSACSHMTATTGKLRSMMGALGVTMSLMAGISFAKSAKEGYELQAEGIKKLETVMRQRMGATNEEIQGIKELTAAQQALGVIGDEVQLSGAQQLATFLDTSSALNTLVPAMNNLLAQQKGFKAGASDAVNIGNLMGKAMQGQVSSLKRVGITFNDAEAAVMTYGNEEQRAAMLAQIITNNVGQMNTALASTPSGRLKQVSNSLSDIKENFGKAVTTALTSFIPAMGWINNLLARMAALANRVAQALYNVFGGTGKAAAAVASGGGAAVGAVDKLTASTEAAGGAAKKLGTFGFDTLQKISSSSSGGGGGSQSGEDEEVSYGGGGFSAAAEETEESATGLERVLLRLKKTYESLDFTKLTASLGRLKAAFEPFKQNIGKGLSWLYDNVLEPLAQWTISSLLPSFLDVLAGALRAVNSVITALAPLFEWLWNSMLKPLAQWTGGVVISALEWLADALSGVSDWINAHQGTVQTIGTILLSVAAAIGVVNGAIALVTGTVKTVTTVVTGIKAALTLLTSPIGLIVAAIAAVIAIIVLCVRHWDEIKAAGQAAIDAIKNAWGDVKEWFSERWNGIKDGWNSAVGAITTGAANARAAVDSAWSNVKEWFGEKWSGIKADAQGAWDGIKKAWGDVKTWWATNVTNPISNMFRDCINGVIKFFEGMANKAIDAVNFIIGGINKISIDIPEESPVFGGTHIGFDIQPVKPITLKPLATGAVLPGGKPYAALVNDQPAGRTNIESPLSTITDAMLSALDQRGQGDQGGIEVNVTAHFEGKLAQLARVLTPYFEAEARRTGPKAVKGGA